MTDAAQSGRNGSHFPIAVILGTNEIASAIAVNLYRGGFGIVLSHDPLPPVIRRKMAFHDALFDDPVSIADVTALRADTGVEIRAGLKEGSSVYITELGVLDLIVIRTLDILVDARMQKHDMTPDLRPLARFTVGVGPGFAGGINCDIAIETRPGKAGRLIPHGSTDADDGIARRLGGRWSERFARAEVPGRWHTAVDIGARVFKDYVVGYLGNMPIRAPFDGILRGVVRDGTEVPAGAKLLEIDARGRRAHWTGIDGRGKVIAAAVTKAIALHKEIIREKTVRTLYLVK